MTVLIEWNFNFLLFNCEALVGSRTRCIHETGSPVYGIQIHNTIAISKYELKFRFPNVSK